ncbi:MAG: glycosyltransferase family 9 protein [Candidatus Omnitrophica bacterium]|nr:glycosyltransferase family 9 protein [Candidatus Omnitrophota bacterium]MBU1127562.1 glycosyltransferase family 9 protein [Candidatus Omnitrophota bacterium]MBU1852398.1 glycosyltransferase family 9 protein [Candidatus Omnitrophota bacterium]
MKMQFFPYKRIILFRQGQFGDTVVTFPIFEALQRLYPQVPLVLCSNHFKKGKYVQSADVARLSPHISEVVTYDVESNVVQKFYELKNKLNVRKDDLLIYLPYSTVRRYQIVRDWIFFKMLNFKNIVCFKEMWSWTYVYEKQAYELPKESERMLRFLRLAGIPVELPDKCLLNFKEDWVQAKWDEWGINGADVLVVCPGSKMKSKHWPVERYIRAGREWNRRTGMKLVVVGGPEEAGLAEMITKHWIGYGFSACGATLQETAAILSRAKAYLGNDTGSMHLAALMGTPCVAIFSAIEQSKLWYPYGNNHKVLREEIECKNCKREVCFRSPPLCLDKISEEQVLKALSDVFEGKYCE